MQAELLSLKQNIVKPLDAEDIYKVGLMSSVQIQNHSGLNIPVLTEPWFVISGGQLQVVETDKGEPYINRDLKKGYIRPVLWLKSDYMTQVLNTKYLIGSYLFTPIPRLNLCICDTYVGGRVFKDIEVFEALNSWKLFELCSGTLISKVFSYDVARYDIADTDDESKYCLLKPKLIMKKKKYQSGAKYSFYGHYFTAITDSILLSDCSFGLVERTKVRPYLLNWIRKATESKSGVSRVIGEACYCISCVKDIEEPVTDEDICNFMAHSTKSVRGVLEEELQNLFAEQTANAAISYTHMNISPSMVSSSVTQQDFAVIHHKAKCCMNENQQSVGVLFRGEAGEGCDRLLRKKRIQVEQSISDIKQKALLKLQKKPVSCPTCRQKVNATGLNCPLCGCSLLSKSMLKQLQSLEKTKAQLDTDLERYYGLHIGLFFFVKVSYLCQ